MSQGPVQNTTLTRYEDIPKTYNKLLALHPLRPIHNDAELDQATEIIDLLAGHELNRDQADYLDVLSTLVEAYENTHHSFDDLVICGLDALRALLDDHGMGAADLGRLLGVHRSMGSKLLQGKRALTTKHLKILSDRFKVSVALFLDRQR
ncbi:MAG: transcriptional regulator [bacterium]|nr:transcriptional regulator [bacterium]